MRYGLTVETGLEIDIHVTEQSGDESLQVVLWHSTIYARLPKTLGYLQKECCSHRGRSLCYSSRSPVRSKLHTFLISALTKLSLCLLRVWNRLTIENLGNLFERVTTRFGKGEPDDDGKENEQATEYDVVFPGGKVSSLRRQRISWLPYQPRFSIPIGLQKAAMTSET